MTKVNKHEKSMVLKFLQIRWISNSFEIICILHFQWKGAFKASAFFGARESENHIKEFNEKYEMLGPLMFGFHDGQTEAPKIQAQKVVTLNYVYLAMP